MKAIKILKEINKQDIKIAGGKGANLGELAFMKMPVPPGFVVLASTFEQFLKETDVNTEINAMWKRINIKDNESIEENSEIVRNLILAKRFPENITKEVFSAFDRLGERYVAVRSSATSEDSKIDAWAGQLESYLYVTRKNLLDSVQKCWASLYTPRALFYRIERKLQRKPISVAVVVQKMIGAKVSGVCFTTHPITKSKDQMIIEACWGLGEALVQGIITPDSYVVDKNTIKIIDLNISSQGKQIIKSKIGTKTVSVPERLKDKQKLPDIKIKELAKLCIKIGNHYQIPQDIEWTIDGQGKIFIVQSRPITTL